MHAAILLLSLLTHPGDLLRPGMRLDYLADGKPVAPWTVVAVEHGLSHAGLDGCTRTELDLGPEGRETRWACRVDALLYELRGDEWRPSRPLGERMRLEQRDDSGRRVAMYETGGHSRQEISGVAVDALDTTVHRFGEDGKLSGRLREKYALALGTATEGVFEVPDPSHPRRWRPVREFKLVGISGR